VEPRSEAQMTDAELIARADANYFQSFRDLVAAADCGESLEAGGVLLCALGVHEAALNVGFVTRRLADPDGAVGRAIAFFDERRLPFVLRVRSGLDESAERSAIAAGLQHTDDVPAMVLPDLASQAPANDAGLDVRAVRDTDGLRVFVGVMASAFGMPGSLAMQMLGPPMLEIPDFEFYAGYDGGVAVATAALFVTHRTAGVYNVATLESHRGRGYGRAMTAHALRRGHELGCVMASLQSSEMGRSVYARMGFEDAGVYRTFGRPS
jgi:ribosomal protein S18 acetylase RimI-like enzyme